MGESGAQRHTEPVGIYTLLDIAQTGIVEIIQLNLVERIVGIVLVYACQFFELQLFAGVHQIVV